MLYLMFWNPPQCRTADACSLTCKGSAGRHSAAHLSSSERPALADEQLDAAYQEVKDVRTVGRALGLYGDVVVELRNGDKIELRSLPKFMELKKYILERKQALAGVPSLDTQAKRPKSKGFA